MSSPVTPIKSLPATKLLPAGVFTSNGNWTDWASGRNFQSGSNPKFSTLDSRCTQNCTKYDSGSSRVLKSSVASKFFPVHLYRNLLDLFAYFKPQMSFKHLPGFIVHYCNSSRGKKKKISQPSLIFCVVEAWDPHTHTHAPTVAAAAGCNTSSRLSRLPRNDELS